MRKQFRRLARLLARAACAASVLLFLAVVWAWLHAPREGYWFGVRLSLGRSFELWTWPAGVRFSTWHDPLKQEPDERFRGGLNPRGIHWEIQDGVQVEMDHGQAPLSMKHRWGFGYDREAREISRRFTLGDLEELRASPTRDVDEADDVEHAEDAEHADEADDADDADLWFTDSANPLRGTPLLIPYWLAALLALILPAVALRRCTVLDRRARRGLCRRCGYDLRESRDAGRCPECGTPTSATAPAGATVPPRWRSRPVVVLAAIASAVAAVAAFVRTTLPGPDPHSPFPMWSERQPFLPEWKPASGAEPRRMYQTTAHGQELMSPWYQAVWKRGDQEFLVVVRYHGAELFGTPYDVYVFDRSLKLVRRGNIGAGQDDTPYGLYEVRSDSHSLPAAYRGDWQLAVAIWHANAKYDASKPVAVTGWGRPNPPEDEESSEADTDEGRTDGEAGGGGQMERAEAEDEDLSPPDEYGQYVYLEPVEWEDVSEEFEYGSGRLSELKPSQSEIRPAEGQGPTR